MRQRSKYAAMRFIFTIFYRVRPDAGVTESGLPLRSYQGDMECSRRKPRQTCAASRIEHVISIMEYIMLASSYE
jgi:hypothetical protein